MDYGQFCPIAKATEIIGEKWTLLVVRELLMGGTRFSELLNVVFFSDTTTDRQHELSLSDVNITCCWWLNERNVLTVSRSRCFQSRNCWT